MSKKAKGFTLIELLVVVAIVSLLSSVVFASLNSARNKGRDAAVKENLLGVRTQAEFLYNQNGGYGVDSSPSAFVIAKCAQTSDTLFADPTIWAQISAADTAGGGLDACISTVTGAGSWAVAIQSKQNPDTETWCVDSSGASKKVSFQTSPPQTQASINQLITDGIIGKCE